MTFSDVFRCTDKKSAIILLPVYLTCTYVSHVALRSSIIFTKFEVGQPIRSWLITFLLLICYAVTLRPWPLTPRPWPFTIHRVSWNPTLYQVWMKSNKLRLSYIDLEVKNWGPSAILDLTGSWFLHSSDLGVPILH